MRPRWRLRRRADGGGGWGAACSVQTQETGGRWPCPELLQEVPVQALERAEGGASQVVGSWMLLLGSQTC